MVQPWAGAPHSWVRFNLWSLSPSLLWRWAFCSLFLLTCQWDFRLFFLNILLLYLYFLIKTRHPEHIDIHQPLQTSRASFPPLLGGSFLYILTQSTFILLFLTHLFRSKQIQVQLVFLCLSSFEQNVIMPAWKSLHQFVKYNDSNNEPCRLCWLIKLINFDCWFFRLNKF